MVDKILIQRIEQEAKEYFENASPCHDWSHIERVNELVNYIGQKEQADLTILQLAALLHDIGREKEKKSNGEICHAEEGSKLAKNILKSYEIDKQIIEQVCHCIETHRFRNEKQPQTIEAKVLYDADKIDSIGAIGIARAYSWAGEHKQNLYSNFSEEGEAGTGYGNNHTPVREFYAKLRNVKNKMLTKTGKEIAQRRHNFTVKFFERLKRESIGEI